MKRILVAGILLTTLLGACASTSRTPPAQRVSGTWDGIEALRDSTNGRTWTATFTEAGTAWTATTTATDQAGETSTIRISGVPAITASEPAGATLTILEESEDASCKVDGVGYSGKAIVTGRFESDTLYRGTERFYICQGGQFVASKDALMQMTRK